MTVLSNIVTPSNVLTTTNTATVTNKTLTSPVLTTPTLGVATATSLQGIIGNVTPAAGAFTSLTASTTLGVTGLSTLTAGAVVQGLTVGLGNGAIATNTVVGYQALASTSVGLNTVYGYQAGYSNTTANLNSYFGYQAGYTLQTGGECSAFGYIALKLNTGANNNAFGGEALALNTTGSQNNAFGVGALGNNLIGSNNVAVGGAALSTNSSGGANTAVGNGALQSNLSASNNTAVGYQAGYTNITGTQGVFIGISAGYTATGSRNTFIGPYVGFSVTIGSGNTFIGNTGSNNSAGSGYDMTSGDNNIIVGGFTGNQDGLDIRTSSAYAVISDGLGRRQITMAEGQTLALDSAVPNAGTGITFPATQSASSDANTLDDYEEGTWTPVLGGDGGGTAMTYAVQIGKYTKIGNVVTADVYVQLSTRGTITGNVVITGLPFTGNTGYNSSVTWGYWNSLGTNWASVGGWLNGGNTIYLGGEQTNNNGIATMAQADIANNSRINVQVIYTLS